jgi:glycosyltransferase
MPTISLVTITYNSAQTIQATLDSIHSQCCDDFEYIIIDAQSTDETLALIDAHPVQVDCLISEPDDGLYDALNKGIANASGLAIGVLHSDDVFASVNSLGLVAGVISRGADACYGDLQYVTAGLQPRVVRQWQAGRYNQKKLKIGWMPPHPTFYMRRDLYKKYGGYDASFRIAGDYDALLRYLWTHKVEPTYIPEVLVQMTIGGASNRSIKNVIQKTTEDIRALKKNKLSWLPAILGKNLGKLPQFFGSNS